LFPVCSDHSCTFSFELLILSSATFTIPQAAYWCVVGPRGCAPFVLLLSLWKHAVISNRRFLSCFFCVICFMLIHVSVLPLLSFGLHFLVFCFFVWGWVAVSVILVFVFELCLLLWYLYLSLAFSLSSVVYWMAIPVFNSRSVDHVGMFSGHGELESALAALGYYALPFDQAWCCVY
jgi:hypothetical protein